MALIESPSVTIPGRGPPPPSAGSPSIVRFQGEHDIATVQVLAAQLARVIASTESDLSIDLSGVTFMDASTVSVIVCARQFLASRDRALTLRSPGTAARRIIKICRLEELLDPRQAGAAASPVTALAS